LRERLNVALTPNEFRHDFAKRLAYAEDMKRLMRVAYKRAAHGKLQHDPQCVPGVFEMRTCPVAMAQRRSLSFWAEYDDINTRFLPEDPTYSAVSQGVTLTTTNSLWQLLAAASGQMRILEHFIGGEATVSTVLRFSLARSVIGTGTTPTTQTPEKFSTRSPAAGTTKYGSATAQVAWGTTQETLNNPLMLHAFNAFGGTDRFVANPGEEIYLVNGEYFSGRSLSGVPVVSAHVIWEEL
jgi:hypothetical protein